jgi:SAM-dependent methyltransferase
VTIPLDHYNQPDLAALYDADNGWDASADFYRALALKTGARSLLDLGCGTGTVTRGIAAAGLAAVGVDPAEPMLRIAQANTRDENVAWIAGDARTIRLGRRFDLVILTGHAFQAFATEADQAALLETIAAHLEAGGRFAFDTRNAAAREWLEWTPELSRRVVETAHAGAVEIWDEAAMAADGRILDVVEHYREIASGRRLRSDFQLRFTPPDELAAAIGAAGLAVENWYGDWDGAPLAEQAREIIVVGGKAVAHVDG